MGEFKGTKGKWKVGDFGSVETIGGFFVCDTLSTSEEDEANALLISKAPEMLDTLKKARLEISRLKLSILAHPDCTNGSEFDDRTTSAQELENEIEQLIKEATEL